MVSELYTEYGPGTIISKNKIFDKEFYKVFFESAGKIIEIQLNDLKPIDSPINLFKSNIFSSPIEFKLNSMAHTIEVMASSEKPSSPANFKINSLPHQLLTLDFVINQFRPRCLLADEVGLGKTIEAVLIMEELKLRSIVKRVLVITPAGLINQWKDELKLKFSEDFSIFDGETFKSFKQLYGQETNCWLKFDQVITSIDFLKPKKIRNDLLEYELKRRQEHNKYVFKDCINANWDMVIIDEAHKLSKYKTGEETARFKLGNKLSESVPIFLILTATPHRGKPYVFKNLLGLVDPYSFNKLEDVKPENIKKMTVRNKKRACIDFKGNRLFKERITTLCKIKWDEGIDEPERKLYDAIVEYVTEYYDYAQREKNNILIFLLMLYQRIVSSSSKAILKSLEKRLETLKSLTHKAKKISESSLDDFFEVPGEKQLEFMGKIAPILSNPELVRKEITIISNCIELAKKAVIGRNDAKLRKLIEIIGDVKKKTNDKNIKILIFTEFIETQKYIIDSLEKIGYKTAFINGKLSLSDRILQKQRFRDEAQILVSTDAGGEGINLQFCYVVINYDLPWNPMQIEQRIGRVDRIGQEKDVIAINFILEDTIEEYVREKIEYKLQLIKEQFGEDKLHDILSTLNEEFNFDRLYVEYIAENRYNDHSLENISDKIYQKAKEILENDEILIPFTDVKKVKDFEIEDIRNISKNNRMFTESFLKNRGLEINEYKDNPGLFYFRNDFRTDILRNYYSKIIFDQSIGLDIEDAELFCIKHPFIKEAIALSKNKGRTSNFYIDEKKFHNTSGLLFNWLLTISNNFNMRRQYLIPTFINNSLKYNRRVSEYLKNMDNLSLEECNEKVDCNIDDYYHQALAVAEKMAENIFWEMEQNWRVKINMDKEKLEKYYRQKAEAIAQIKIDNIREGKQNELRKEKAQKLTELKKETHLFPELDCIQIAKITFR
ncbi:MAG: helicase-related protein [Candidatus Hodarchaeales archaeon]